MFMTRKENACAKVGREGQQDMWHLRASSPVTALKNDLLGLLVETAFMFISQYSYTSSQNNFKPL